MHKKVSFTAMENGTQEDYALLGAFHEASDTYYADRVLGWLKALEGDSPYQISRLEHCLQTATRAENDGADDETIVCALLHDIGDHIAPGNHSQIAAVMLAPFVSEKNLWIVKHHGLFQGYYYFHFTDADRNARERYKEHPYYQDCINFCANWDQPSFDPDFETRALTHFEPKLRALFAKEPGAYY
jgi:predicted HD phosphohydrolase